jgi:hypothetical protein
MSEPDGSIAQAFPRATAIGRYVFAIVAAGVIAALAWMFVLAEGHTGTIFRAKWTKHDFPDGLGNLFGAADTARAGLYLTLVLGVIVAAIFPLVERWLPGRDLVKGISFAAPLFLAWGLLFTPLVDSRQEVLVKPESVDFVYLPTGFFGVDAGARTIISGAVASLLAGIIIARVIQITRHADWWRPHPTAGVALDPNVGRDPLLELTEQGSEQGGERSR